MSPIDPNLDSADSVLDSEEAFYQVLTKIYAGFSVSGQEGPSGDGDLSGFDEGHSQYWRAYFVCQELPTDECVNGWADGDLPALSQVNWGANNSFIRQFYYRSIYQVSLANEFIRQANTNGSDEYENLPQYIAEARFLRALAYWHALDLFGNGIPFTTEEDAIGSDLPMPAGEARGPELFNYIESELLAIVGDTDDDSQVLLDPGASMGGQANKAAAWMVLAKLYLNHSVYLGETNTDYYSKAKTYLEKINTAGYSLITEDDAQDGDVYSPYERLFIADNYSADNEIIYSINYDGYYTQTYGGMVYLIAAAVGGDQMKPQEDFGISGGWGGNRTTKALVNKFDDADGRALWFTTGQSLEIEDLTQFTNGYAVMKFRNKMRDGSYASNEGNSNWVDVNVPVFRLADAYLMAAEVDLRLDGAVSATSKGYLQEIADRAGTTLPSSITLDWLLDERARELYWECHRRTDLVRFGKFTSGYNWPWKGNTQEGKDVDDKFDLMPIPYTDITANPNLTQNPNY